MRAMYFSAMFFLVFAGCVYATNPMSEKEGVYVPVEASLTSIDQKVTHHFLATGIPDGFNKAQFKTAVEEICNSNPSCRSQAETIFSSYGIRVRKIDDMFSVMLCDIEMKYKVMEDFNCNNMRVEIKSWKMPDQVDCDFEKDVERIKLEHCKD